MCNLSNSTTPVSTASQLLVVESRIGRKLASLVRHILASQVLVYLFQMSQYNVSCRLGQRSHVSLNEKSTSAVDYGLFTCRPVTKMKHLLEEFKGLYEERLKRIDFDTKGSTQEDMLRMKLNVLQSYINDLGDQNQVLIQTVEDLEKEANDKVASLEVKLRTSDDIINGLAQQRKDLEERTCALLSENEDLRSDVDSLRVLGWPDAHTHIPDVISARPGDTVGTELIGSARTQAHTAGRGERAGPGPLILELSRRSGLPHSLDVCSLRPTQLEEKERVRHLKEKEERLKEQEEEWREERRRMRKNREEEKARKLSTEKLAEKAAILQTEVKEREDRLRHLLQDVAALNTTQESLSRTLSMKEQHTHLALALLQDKVSEDTVGAVRVEVEQLEVDQLEVEQLEVEQLEVEQVRARLAEETGQSQLLQNTQDLERLQSQLLQNTQDLERAQQQLANTRSAAAKKIHRRESKMAALLKELSECKKKHSDSQDELLSAQALMKGLQEDRTLTGSKMEEQNRELQELRQHRDTLKTQLAVTSDKHHAAHNLVSSRDQMILQLRSQLRTAEQMHQGSAEELAVLEAEVNRLNLKVKGQQEEACHLWEKVREGAELRNQEEKERLELQKQLCTSQQQVKTQAGKIDHMTSDLEAVKQAHRTDTERWTQRNFLLHSQLEQVSCELSQSQAGVREQGLEVKRLRERLSQAEAGMQQALQKVEVSEGLLKTRDAEIILLHKQLASVQENLKESSSRGREQLQLAAIFRQKYSASLGKLQRHQGQRDGLEEELRCCQQQLGEAKREVGGIKAELAELKGRYQEKLGQWESSEEALEQLTDELQSNQSALRESQERVGQCEGLIAALQQQLDSGTQQVEQCEGSLRSYQKQHSYSDEEYCSLQKHIQLLQRRCTEQAERLAESQQRLIQARAEGLHQTEELERQTQKRVGLEQSLQSLHLDLAASHRTHIAKHTHLQQEMTRLQQEVRRLGLELDTARNSCSEKEQEVQERGALLQQCEEDLKETRACLERRSRELEETREEAQREERDRRSTDQQNQRLRCHLEELHTLHTHSVVELAAAEDEVRRLEGRASEGRQAEEKRRATVEGLQQGALQLRQALQQAAEETVNTHRDKQLTLQQLDSLQVELEGAHCDNTQLHQEGQLVVSQVNLWVKEQRMTSESLAAQIRAQNKVLILITEEKENLQQANDSLKQDLRMLGGELEERKREARLWKVQDEEKASKQQQEIRERESCVLHNLSRLQEMQARLQANLEDIAVLNQQLGVLGGENKALHRQLKEERSRSRRAELLNQPSTHLHQPLPNKPPSLLPQSLCPSPGPGEHYVKLTRAELSMSGPQAPGKPQAVGGAFWRGRVGELSAHLQDSSPYWSAPTGSTSSLT